MRTLLFTLPLLSLLLLPLAVVACGDDPATTPDPEEAAEPDVPTPPPVTATSEELLAVMPQEPLPDGVQSARVDPIDEGIGSPAQAPPPTSVEPAPVVAATTPPPPGSLEIVEAVIAREVVDRQPRGDGPFAEGTEVHCYTRIANPAGTRRQIKHVWYHEGARKSSIPLNVKAETWRTWSNVPVHGKGAWRVDVVDEAGTVLKSLPFRVE
jgi:hypothetical protein